MPSLPTRKSAGQALARLSLAVLPLMAACGGGAADDADTTVQTSSAAEPEGRAQALDADSPAVGTLLLASSTSTGQARRGNTCGVSADGSRVLFSSNDALIGTNGNSLTDLYLKNLRTGAINRINTRADESRMGVSNPATCLR